MMSRKDYVAIANVLRRADTGDQTGENMIRTIAGGLASHFRADNVAFDTERFYEACGYSVPRREGEVRVCRLPDCGCDGTWHS